MRKTNASNDNNKNSEGSIFFSEKDSTNPSLHHFNPIVIARVV